jgi:hypothetical protein
MRASLVTLGFLLVVAAPVIAEVPPPTPAPEGPIAAPTSAPRLDLGDLSALQEGRGHAEFDLGLRREIWNDPMTRLAYGISREQASQMRGGAVPPSATDMLVVMPGPDLRQVLAGPYASDWHDLTTQEKIGRIGEGAVYWGLVIGILSSIHRP